MDREGERTGPRGPRRSRRTTLRSWWRASGTAGFVARIAGVGAFAGLVAWLLVLALHLVFGVSRPSLSDLLLAIPRGALFGAILALALIWYWRRSPGRERER